MGRIWAIAALVVLAAAPAGSAPDVRIEAKTAIELDAIRRTSRGIVVRGRVKDANSGEALGGANVVVAVGGRQKRVTSDDDGTFSVPFDIEGASFDIAVDAEGPYLGQSRTEIQGFEVSKRPLDLTLSIGPVTTTEVVAVVRASSEGSAVPSLEARLEVDGKAAGVVRTDNAGRGELRLPRRAQLGKPGRKSFSARFAGNALYDPATATASELLVVETELDVELTSLNVSYEDEIEGSGLLQDKSGRPIRQARVDLVSATGDVLDSAVTGDDGRFDLEVDANELGPGAVTVQVVFDSPQPWFESTRSKNFTVDIAEPEPIPVAYTLGAFGTTAFALLAFIGLRTKPWERWRRSTGDDKDDDEAIDDDPVPERPVVGGLQQNRPSIISTIRRPNDFGFSALVRDAVSHAPIARARIVLTMAEETRESDTDEGGAASFEGLTAGAWRAEAKAAFYVTESFSVSVPHRGELRGAHLDLVPVRERIFDLYRQAALPLLPEASLWGIWTPRQIIDHVRGQQARPALAELTNFVEESYFSQRTPVESVLPQAAELVAAANAESAQ